MSSKALIPRWGGDEWGGNRESLWPKFKDFNSSGKLACVCAWYWAEIVRKKYPRPGEVLENAGFGRTGVR